MLRAMNEGEQTTISENLNAVRQKITLAAQRVNRSPEEITLVAVSKTVGVAQVREAYAAGQRVFGENRIQECQEKVLQLTRELSDIRFTMIGHLQSNKVKKAVELFPEIQSVDSVKIAREISRRAGEADKTINVFIELNSSGESAKHGIDPAQAQDVAGELIELPDIILTGVMTLGPLTDNEAEIRSAFKRTREVHDSLRKNNIYQTADGKPPQLSMGMSGDFEIAIEEGSDMVRVGTAIFGPRTK